MGDQTAALAKRRAKQASQAQQETAPAQRGGISSEAKALQTPALKSLAGLPVFPPAEVRLSSPPNLHLLIQPKLAIASVDDPLEAEADAIASRVVSGSASAGRAVAPRAGSGNPTLIGAPARAVEEVASPGKPLDPAVRAFMEPRFGRDFGEVRIHTGLRAQESARAVNALAYTVGQHAVFAEGQYRPDSREGRKLLAHELTHTVQQSQGARERGPGSTSVNAVGLYRQEASPQKPDEAPKPMESTVVVSWDDLLNQKLTLPSLLQPREQQPLLPSPGTLTLGTTPQFNPPAAPAFPLNLSPATSDGLVPPSPSPLLPTPGSVSGQPAGPAPEAPSRLSVVNSGRLSIGLRLGFPDLDASVPGTPPSAAQQALQQGQILNQILTGQVPSAWQSLDKGTLAKAVWQIFSTYIAPDAARKITSSLSGKAGPKGVSYELDGVLLTDFSGGGISFTLRY